MDPDALFREHRAGLVRYLHRLSGDFDVADDIVQETFVRAMERPPDDTANVRGWLYTVATNLLRDRARRTERVGRVEGEHAARRDDAASGRSPPAEAERTDVRARLFAALAALTEKERVAVVMRQEGFTHREIADCLGTTTGTIGTLLARALAKLARRLPLDREDA